MCAILLRLTLATTISAAACPALIAAEPVSGGAGYGVSVVRKEGAAFSGLAEDDSGLVVTDLADGRLYRFNDGTFVAFGPALPHGLDVIGDPTGPYRIAASADGYVVAQGWKPVDADESPLDHAMLEITEGSPPRVISSDFWNPFAFLVEDDGLFVIDAARNTLEQLSATGERRTLYSFARLAYKGTDMQGLSPTEFSKNETYEVDSVPTAIALNRGRIFVTQFGGFPYLDGGGRIVSVDAVATGRPMRVEMADLNAPVDISVTGDGDLSFVLEHGRYDRETGFLPGTGRLLAVDLKTDTRQPIASGLTRPVSFLQLGDGRIAVACLDGTLVFLSTGNGKPL